MGSYVVPLHQDIVRSTCSFRWCYIQGPLQGLSPWELESWRKHSALVRACADCAACVPCPVVHCDAVQFVPVLPIVHRPQRFLQSMCCLSSTQPHVLFESRRY